MAGESKKGAGMKDLFLDVLRQGEEAAKQAANKVQENGAGLVSPPQSMLDLLEKPGKQKATAAAAEQKRLAELHAQAFRNTRADEADGEYSDGGKQIGKEWEQHNKR